MSEQKNPVMELRAQIERQAPEFAKILPAHIPTERFTRVLYTAIQREPSLASADRKSLFESLMACAEDGLFPDGREAALVPYKGKITYIPMIAGLRKKVRQSGEIVSWEARLVRENDHFEVVYGDDERIDHTPNLFSPGKIVAAYSIATFRDGYKSREVMTIDELEAIRQKSKAQGGPWADPVFKPEMYRKTVMRRHSKALPLSPELRELISRDDHLITLPRSQYRGEAQEPRQQGATLGAIAAPANGNGAPRSLDDFAAAQQNDESASGNGDTEATQPASDDPPAESEAGASEKASPVGANADYDAGWRAGLEGKTKRAMPADIRDDDARADAWRRGLEAGLKARGQSTESEGAEV